MDENNMIQKQTETANCSEDTIYSDGDSHAEKNISFFCSEYKVF